MNTLHSLPVWATWLVATLVFCGALLTCIGSAGLLRMQNFYQRVHTPTLGTTLGLFLILAGAIVFFSLQHGQPVLNLLLIGAGITVTTPVTLVFLSRAALVRERQAKTADEQLRTTAGDSKNRSTL